MAHFITQFLILCIITIFTAFSSSSNSRVVLAQNIPSSAISAAPAILPDDPFAPSSAPPPALSPDITPLFPSPGGSELSPSDSSLPIIPSSPSPPNPDAMAAPGPGMAFAPFGLMPDSASEKLNVPVFLSSAVVLCLVAF